MGFWSSICSAVSSAVSSVCSFISSTASSMLSTVGALAAKVSPIIQAISIVIQVVGAICDLLKPNEQLPDKGEAVLQAAENGITLESCDNDFEEYKKRIEEFEIDPTKKHSETECLVAGASYVIKGITEFSPYLRDFPDMLTLCYHGTKNQLLGSFFSSERVKTLTELAQSMQVDIGKVKSYFDGSLATSDFDKVDSLLHESEKKMNPEYSEKDFDKRISDVTDEVRKLDN